MRTRGFTRWREIRREDAQAEPQPASCDRRGGHGRKDDLRRPRDRADPPEGGRTPGGAGRPRERVVARGPAADREEAGIEPHLVEEAVALLRRQAQASRPARRKSRSGETRWEQRVELPVRLDNEDVRALLAQLEAEFGGQGTITELSCGTVWTFYRMRDGHTHAAVEARDRGTRLHVALDRSTQRKFVRRVGAVVGGVLFSFVGMASGDEGAFMVLTSLGLIAGNLTGRGAWRVLAPRWADRLDRLMSTLSGEAMRNGTPVGNEPAAAISSTPTEVLGPASR